MEGFAVRTTLTLDDWRAYQEASTARARAVIGAWASPWGSAVLTLAIAALGVVPLLLGAPLNYLSFLVGMAWFAASMLIGRRLAAKKLQPEAGGQFIDSYGYDFDASGMRIARSNATSAVGWPYVKAISANAQYLYLWVDQYIGYVVPVRDLPEGVTAADAQLRFAEWIKAATGTEIGVDSSGAGFAGGNADAVDRTPATVRALFKALLRLLTLRRADASAITGSELSVLVAGIACAAVWLLVDWMRAGSDARFHLFNLSSVAFFALAILLTCVPLVWFSRPRVALGRVLIVVAALLPLAIVAAVLMDEYTSEYSLLAAVIVFAVYAVVYMSRAMWTLTGKPQSRSICSALAVALMMALLGLHTTLDPAMWFGDSADEKDASASAWQDSEQLMFDQQARIDDALDRITASAQDKPAMFFVGFAGVGNQRVFAEEIKLASLVVGRRYHIGERSLLLLNDERDVDSQPLASISGLRYALRGLADKMDVERDILFLSLSSHGSNAPPLLAVANGGLPLNDVTPTDLAAALKDSGIKWRVIVISACHAGVFIDSLRDPYTIVITAAAADKTSFGCSNDRDLTYFGEAFYRDALPPAQSLRTAFEAAKRSIAEREQQEKITASDPQAFFGAQIEAKLQEPKR